MTPLSTTGYRLFQHYLTLLGAARRCSALLGAARRCSALLGTTGTTGPGR
ncbi:hypothetical protein OIE73_16930 [Streptomyces hirsutus]|uniref:Uncharacterized protein n=1 Tax=Streptomyces hirsutus TaxID=35620 RepID=A0ABZ1GQ50_9ACTN|nr:hypothetical protein [Streptomyces hirsutus]WSD07279.1 hypothetical protein OIE73_16930 [Streptomyces hirsutus]